jgi:hypothetical protein
MSSYNESLAYACYGGHKGNTFVVKIESNNKNLLHLEIKRLRDWK